MAYKCTKCGAEFSSRDALREHQFGHIYDDRDAARTDQPDERLDKRSETKDEDESKD